MHLHCLAELESRPRVVCAASAVPAVLIACIGFADCELRYVAVTILCLAYFANNCCRAGMMVNHVDISPKYGPTFYSACLHSVTISVFTARCTIVQSAVLRSHVVCPSVCLSVCDVGGS